MTTRTIPIGSAERGNEVIRRIYVKSSTDRARNNVDAITIKVGVARGSDVDILGQWSQRNHGLNANEKFAISGEGELNYQLDEDDEIVAIIETQGSVSTLDGMSIEVKGARVGEVGDGGIERTDGDFPAASAVISQLFSVASNIDDRATRDSFESLIAALNDSGITDWSITHALGDTRATVAELFEVASYSDFDATLQSVTSTSYTDGNVSITVLVPAGKTVRVLVTSSASFDSSHASLAVGGLTAIGDGTTDHNETSSVSSKSAFFHSAHAMYAGEITEDTVFTLRLKKSGAQTPRFINQGISALAVAA